MAGERNLFNDVVKYGKINSIWDARKTRIIRYQQEISHERLKECKIITAPDINVLYNKVRFQVEKWNKKWMNIQEKNCIKDINKIKTEEA